MHTAAPDDELLLPIRPLPVARAASSSPPRSLRFSLFLLAASGLLPLAVVLLGAITYLAHERQKETQRSALELSRALATAVDAELRSTVAQLQNLATATQLADLPPEKLGAGEFISLARRVAESQHWRQLVIADDTGTVVGRTGAAPSNPRVPIEPESIARVLSTRQSAVGAVSRGPSGQDAYSVRVPVVKGERVRYVISAIMPTTQMLSVISRQQLAPTWTVAVYDQTGARVARSRETPSTRYSATLEQLIAEKGREGAGVTRTLEGVESHTGFSRISGSRWIVAVGIPSAESSADLYRMLAAVGAGTTASLGFLAWLAWRTARGISGPIDALKRAAADLGLGKSLHLPRLGLAELDDVGLALRRAAAERDEANALRDGVERERERLLVRLEEALRVAEQANRNKDEFLALLGHELRNPLAPIMNAVHLIGLKGDDKTLPERQIILRQLKYVTRLVDDLLDASRITSNRFVINLRPLRPAAVLEQTVESLRPSFGTRALQLRIDEAARALWARADEARLVQVFNNLLGNAIKFTPQDGVIEVQARAADNAIEFSIRDSGVGMKDDELLHAFDLFYQAPNSARGVNGGLGLGLAIVRSLVEMHAGRVAVHSDGPNQGTTVTVSLPTADPTPQDSAAPRAPAGVAAVRVLVVDDNTDAADTLATLLQAAGYVPQVVYTPQSALDAAIAFGPGVVILDIGLPEMDGYEVARRLRCGAPAFRGKLIALTGYGQQQDVRKALDAGFDAHLTKPVDPDALLDAIAKLHDSGSAHP